MEKAKEASKTEVALWEMIRSLSDLRVHRSEKSDALHAITQELHKDLNIISKEQEKEDANKD